MHPSVVHRPRPAAQILAVTFTNKAREMKERIGALIGNSVEACMARHVHSIGAQILRRHAELVGLKSSFTILDTDDPGPPRQTGDRGGRDDEKRWDGRSLATVIDAWKNRGLTPEPAPQMTPGILRTAKASRSTPLSGAAEKP
ncbi:MAG: UvrD-helicase domain-containing protein [Parvularculaceae bacterium]